MQEKRCAKCNKRLLRSIRTDLFLFGTDWGFSFCRKCIVHATDLDMGKKLKSQLGPKWKEYSRRYLKSLLEYKREGVGGSYDSVRAFIKRVEEAA